MFYGLFELFLFESIFVGIVSNVNLTIYPLFFIYKGNLSFITENEQIFANLDIKFSRE
mgnify:CR=1 FL=1